MTRLQLLIALVSADLTVNLGTGAHLAPPHSEGILPEDDDSVPPLVGNGGLSGYPYLQPLTVAGAAAGVQSGGIVMSQGSDSSWGSSSVVLSSGGSGSSDGNSENSGENSGDDSNGMSRAQGVAAGSDGNGAGSGSGGASTGAPGVGPRARRTQPVPNETRAGVVHARAREADSSTTARRLRLATHATNLLDARSGQPVPDGVLADGDDGEVALPGVLTHLPLARDRESQAYGAHADAGAADAADAAEAAEAADAADHGGSSHASSAGTPPLVPFELLEGDAEGETPRKPLGAGLVILYLSLDLVLITGVSWPLLGPPPRHRPSPT
jgi:hypothetical protein